MHVTQKDVEHVVDMPAEVRRLATYHCVERGAPYIIAVYEAGKWAGTVHFKHRRKMVKARNCFVQTAEDAMDGAARFVDLAKSFNNLEVLLVEHH